MSANPHSVVQFVVASPPIECSSRNTTTSFCQKHLLLLSLTEEYNYYQNGVLPSQFYSALTGKDFDSFKDTLWKMAVIIVSVCVVS